MAHQSKCKWHLSSHSTMLARREKKRKLQSETLTNGRNALPKCRLAVWRRFEDLDRRQSRTAVYAQVHIHTHTRTHSLHTLKSHKLHQIPLGNFSATVCQLKGISHVVHLPHCFGFSVSAALLCFLLSAKQLFAQNTEGTFFCSLFWASETSTGK